jgi:hypothetical protein
VVFGVERNDKACLAGQPANAGSGTDRPFKPFMIVRSPRDGKHIGGNQAFRPITVTPGNSTIATVSRVPGAVTPPFIISNYIGRNSVSVLRRMIKQRHCISIIIVAQSVFLVACETLWQEYGYSSLTSGAIRLRYCALFFRVLATSPLCSLRCVFEDYAGCG